MKSRGLALFGAGVFLEPPYNHGVTWAVDGLGRAHLAPTGDYALDVYAPDGSVLRRVEMDVSGIRIDDGLRERWRERACRPGGPCPADQAMALPGPEYLPVVEEIWGFGAGHIAVRRADKKTDPADRFERGPWDLFDPEGAFLGTLAADVRPLWFDGETLLTIERGELNVEQVVMYRVR